QPGLIPRATDAGQHRCPASWLDAGGAPERYGVFQPPRRRWRPIHVPWKPVNPASVRAAARLAMAARSAESMPTLKISRRQFLERSSLAAAIAMAGGLGGCANGNTAGTGSKPVGDGDPTRGPNSLPDPGRAAGSADDSLPFDHVVVVMMENHS